MAALDKIRSKAGFLVVIIGVALLAFIIGDFLNSGHTFYAMSKNKVAVVNGQSISTEDFQEKVRTRTDEVQEYYRQRGATLPEGYTSRLNQEVLDQMINELILNENLENLGIEVSKEELTDLLCGDHVVLMVSQYFMNPETGQLDKNALMNFISVVTDPEGNGYVGEMRARIEPQRQMWMNIEKGVKQERLVQKYAGLLTELSGPNALETEAAYNDAKTTANISYAVQSFYSIPDSTVTVSEKEVKAAYNKEKESFRTPERRSMKYITVDIVPSENDYAEVQGKMDMLEESFKTTDDVANFLANNSDEVYANEYVAVRSLSPELKAFAEKAGVNAVYGPVFENDTHSMYRVMGTKVAPDSIQVRLLSFAPGSTQTDSVLNVLRKGGDFDALMNEFGGNNEIWITESMWSALGRPFVDKVFSTTGNGFFKAESLSAEHVLQITKRTAPVKKVNLAELTLAVNPSTDTYTNLYNGLSSYIATNNSVAKFESAAQEAGYMVNTMDATAADFSLPGVMDARQAIRWAFNADKGDISEIFTSGDKFVVAALDGVTPEGYAPLSEIRAALEMRIRNDKKAEALIQSLKAQNLNSMDAYAKAMKTTVSDAKFVSFASPSISGVGFEPAISGLAPYAKKGEIVGPVKGNRGVYVFTVTDKEVSAKPFDAAAEAERLKQASNGIINSQLMNVLRDKAEIENTMIRFF